MALAGCSRSYDDPFNQGDNPFSPSFGPGTIGGSGTVSNDGTSGIDGTISSWDGSTATDADKDVAGTDEDIYHEANSFKRKVTVEFTDGSAQVTTSDSKILSRVDGGYVTIDMATNTVSGVEVELSGSSSDGGIKIYGSKKFKLTLNGLTLTSKRGPAINNQCKKRVFLHVADGTTNTLLDPANYTDDPYTLDSSVEEDRKGCFFSESDVIMSGHGILSIAGSNKHALATDDSFIMRPGCNLIITGAAKNGLQAKGDSDTETGVKILGGYIYANVSSEAGKAIKSDLNVEIEGGTLELNTSGKAIYDTDEKDTSSAAGIKTDGNIIITGGTITAKSTGSGGKGLNADGEIKISGGETTVSTTGDKYYYTSTIDASPKGVKADGNVTISGGKLSIAATGRNDGAEGLESKATLTISGGEVDVYAYDDAINAKTAINITGGSVTAYSGNNDGIDSNGTLTISGGTVLASGSSAPEGGLDADSSNYLKINGGTVIAMGGTMQSTPSSSSAQYGALYSSFTASKGATVKLLDSSSKSVIEFVMPRTISSGSLYLSAAALTNGSQYTITVAGTTVATFSISSKVTYVSK